MNEDITFRSAEEIVEEKKGIKDEITSSLDTLEALLVVIHDKCIERDYKTAMEYVNKAKAIMENLRNKHRLKFRDAFASLYSALSIYEEECRKGLEEK